MEHIFPFLGHWGWFVAAGLFLLLELLSPGIFFLWLGMAAALTGLVDSFVHLPWQMELLLFPALSALSVLIGRKFYSGVRLTPEDHPFLNRRQLGYVGRRFLLTQPIVNGRGSVTIEDTIWEAKGPDIAAGTWVTVTAAVDMILTVAPSPPPSDEADP